MPTTTTKRQREREQFLEARRSALGASDIAAIFNLSPYTTAWEVQKEKLGQLDPDKSKPWLEHGNAFESAVLDIAAEKLGSLIRNRRMQSNTCQRICAQLDAKVIKTGEPVDAKTTGLTGPVIGNWGDEGTDQVPEYILIQLQSQLICTETDVGHVFALVAGRGTLHYQVAADAEMQLMIKHRATKWWQDHVIDEKPVSLEALPPLDVLKRIRRQPNRVLHLPPEAEELASRLEWCKKQVKKNQTLVDEIKAGLLVMLDDAECGLLPDGRRIEYYETTRRNKAREAFETKYRTLRIKDK